MLQRLVCEKGWLTQGSKPVVDPLEGPLTLAHRSLVAVAAVAPLEEAAAHQTYN